MPRPYRRMCRGRACPARPPQVCYIGVMRILAALLLCAAGAFATIEAFGLKWSVPIGSEWVVEGQGADQVMKMLVARPATQPRRPAQHAMALTQPFQDVTVEAEVKRMKSSLIFVYAWRDE